MSCVVCGGPVETACFANDWENARRLYPCCSPACAQRFDADVHWLPAARPSEATRGDEARLLAGAKQRLGAGDRPALVVRDLLLAGIGIPAARKLLLEAEAQVTATGQAVRRFNIVSIVAGLFGVRGMRAHNRDLRDPVLLQAAHKDLARWTARFDARSSAASGSP